MLEQLTIHRRALHRIPELDDQLPETQAYLLDRLSPLRCRIITPVSYTHLDVYKRQRLNYEGKYSFQGCYWVDYECKVGTRETQSRNTIIYGHNTAVSQDDPNGLDFAQLLRFTRCV